MTLRWFRKKDGKFAVAPAPAQAPSNAHSGLNNHGRFGKLLTEDLVLWLPAGKTKEEHIALLVERLCAAKGLGEPRPFLTKVLEREQGMSTTLDTGLAIPHARIEGLPSICAALGLLRQGMTDPKQTDITIRAICVFFSPYSPNRQEVFQQHLFLLRGVSALFQPAFLDEVLAKKTSAEVLELIDSRESV
jgi:nitrogen PTS system EIIA component